MLTFHQQKEVELVVRGELRKVSEKVIKLFPFKDNLENRKEVMKIFNVELKKLSNILELGIETKIPEQSI